MQIYEDSAVIRVPQCVYFLNSSNYTATDLSENQFLKEGWVCKLAVCIFYYGWSSIDLSIFSL